ncbi:MAG: hypothetical protein JXR48_08515 [Candidatus Delongbacteria bacterium]|nr:hypothetical protein [Candidatus Delongbacteria bacterium]
MILSDIGRIALKYWENIPKCSSNVKLDEYVIMPDHIHGIISLTSDPVSASTLVKTLPRNVSPECHADETRHDEMRHDEMRHDEMRHDEMRHDEMHHDEMRHDEMRHDETLRGNVCTGGGRDNMRRNRGDDNIYSNMSPKAGSLSAIIRSYKSICSKVIHKKYPDFAWHTRFHDRIIRTEKELFAIRHYIRNNPIKWESIKYDK